MAYEYAGHFSCEPHDEMPSIRPAASIERAITFFIILFLDIGDKATKVIDRFIGIVCKRFEQLIVYE